MGNQAINSLALISARYTHTAIECLSKICAVYLYILCQALDLRAMDLQFQKLLKLEISIVTRDVFDDALGIEEDLCELQEMLVRHALRQLTVTTVRQPHPFIQPLSGNQNEATNPTLGPRLHRSLRQDH